MAKTLKEEFSMKKSILKIAVPTLALGLAFAPMASASAHQTSQKTVVSIKTVTSTTVSKHLTAKEKEAIKKLASITKNISKVEANVTKLAKATTDFYTKAATTPVSSKVEAEFYASTSGKLKANTNQLNALKKQVGHVAKKYKNTDAVAAAFKKIADLNSAISVASKNLNDLHKQFKTVVSEQDAKERFTAISSGISKVEVGVAELTKATVDFYAKATTIDSVTVKAEAEFYKTTAYRLNTNANQLETLKKQLDYVAKSYKDTNALAAAYNKISSLKTVVSTASKNLTDLHTQFTAKVKEQEAKAQLTLITNEISKVEANVAALLKTTAEFYAKAATDSSITVKVEAEFYTRTSGALLDNTKQLFEVKKQLDSHVKKYGQSADVTAAYSKFTTQNQTITAALETLIKLHTNFKPVATTTTTP
jgi:hypothetical protein